MRVILVVLSGDARRAHERVSELFPAATVETIPRSEIENGNLTTRLRALRRQKPQVDVVARHVASLSDCRFRFRCAE